MIIVFGVKVTDHLKHTIQKKCFNLKCCILQESLPCFMNKCTNLLKQRQHPLNNNTFNKKKFCIFFQYNADNPDIVVRSYINRHSVKPFFNRNTVITFYLFTFSWITVCVQPFTCFFQQQRGDFSLSVIFTFQR